MKIFLTADVHLGMRFTGYPPDVRQGLIGARFDALKTCVRTANENECDVFAVAGDLFDSRYVGSSDVVKAAKIIDGFEGRVAAVLPGNHDFVSAVAADIWNIFSRNSGDNVLVLSEKRVYSLSDYGLSAALYAAPCDAKHSEENRVAWISESEKNSGTVFHIGIAHGTLEGTAADIEGYYYPMALRDLLRSGLDCWLLGHVHKPYPCPAGVGDRVFYPGVPEPDGFDCSHEGGAWQLEIDGDKKVTSTFISTGMNRFLHEDAEFSTAEDFADLEEKFGSGDFSRYLVKFDLSGKLPRDAYERLPRFVESLKDRLYYFEIYTDRLSENITPAVIDSEFTQGSFPHLLLSGLAGEVSPEVLQIAYDMIREARL